MLEERGAVARVVRYLEQPPTVEQLDAICTALACEPTEILRAKEKRFGELGLSIDEDRSREAWLQIMVENPVLIERPIVCVGSGPELRCVVGRPPERLAALFDSD